MIMCLPIPVYNKITEQKESSTIAIINISLDFLNIEEDPETGNAILKYHTGKLVEVLVPFTSLLAEIGNESQRMVYMNISDCKRISTKFKKFCEINNI